MSRYSFGPPPTSPRWFRAGSVDVTTTVLITGIACISLFGYAIDPSLLEPLALIGDKVLHGEIWRLVTWPLLNVPAWSPVIGIAMFWYFGSRLEAILGRVPFLWFSLVLTLAPAVVAAIFAQLTGSLLAVGGMDLLASSVIVAFVAAYPTARTFFDLPLWGLVVVFIGVDALQYAGDRAWTALVFLAAGVATALLAARAVGISPLAWIPRLPAPGARGGGRSGGGARRKRRPSSAKLQVVRGADIDSLLDKIARDGIGSLTPDERRRLDEHSRRLS